MRKGAYQAKIETAKILSTMHLSCSDIAKATGLAVCMVFIISTHIEFLPLVDRRGGFSYNRDMEKQNTQKQCPCGSGKLFADCCGPVIAGKTAAKTAESLMRARYSAYVMHDIDFIVSSCAHEKGENNIDTEETRRWSEESEWLGLKIINTEKGGENDTQGIVEFSAAYSRKGLKDVHKEKAEFVKENGRWLYKTGTITPVTIVREGKKPGRNESCPCGSGKKYKHCCGR